MGRSGVTMDELREAILKYALQNALFHGGAPQKGPVMGKLMAERPELKPRAREIAGMMEGVLAEVGAMDEAAIRSRLGELAPELTERKVRERGRSDELPDLEGADGGVVMRFAPSPSGPLHIGHSRAAVLNDEYVRRYGGRLILRLEDTNPENIMPDAYDMIPEDMRWLGARVDEVVVQSDRFDTYLEHARQVLGAGGAYVCDCDVERWRELKNGGEACPHRDLPPEVQLAAWEGMLDGTYAPGDASMVVKTDLSHPNPAVRDFVAYRIVEAPHPRTGDRYRVYPMYNFSVVIDDHLMGMTHVLRGKDHLNNTVRQEYLYRHLGWEPPRFFHYGWVSIDETILKTTTIREGIASGLYDGWDDVRLGTFRSLARRGYDPDSLRRYWKETGIKDVDITFSWETLDAMDKDLWDPRADRYSFADDPVLVKVSGSGPIESRAPVHPADESRGLRVYRLEPGAEGAVEVLLSSYDRERMVPGARLRLKELGNVEMEEAPGGAAGPEGLPAASAKYIGDDLSILKQGAAIVHWVPADGSVAGEVTMPDGSKRSGRFEPMILEALGEVPKVVQLERFGFANLRLEDGRVTGAYLHY